MKIWRKITDYKLELDLHYGTMMSLSKKYVQIQAFLLILMIPFFLFFFKFDKSGFSGISILLPFWSYIFIFTKIQAIISMYLRDRNIEIYNKYNNHWDYIRGYYPLASINLRKLNDEDLSKITDERIIQLIYAKRKAYWVCVISIMVLIGLMVVKSCKLI